MLAIQAALDVDEVTMAYALVMDSICATLYVMFLLWAIGNHEKFNKWTKADTSIIDGVGAALEEEAKANTKPLVWQNIILLLGSGLLVSAVSMELGSMINAHLSFFDSTTWTVLIVSVLGIVFALTPFGKIKGTEEISNVMLYIVIALIASRADLGAVGNAPIWLLAGFVILLIHVAIMIALAKILKLDIFTCCVASLANISRSFFADSSYMLSFSVLCSCVCSRLISPSVSSWHKQDNTLMHQSPGHIQRRTPYNF